MTNSNSSALPDLIPPCWFCERPSVVVTLDEERVDRAMCRECAEECDAARKREDDHELSQCHEEMGP